MADNALMVLARVSRTAAVVLGAFMILESGCTQNQSLPGDPEAGVSLDLAQARSKSIQDLRYDVSFAIPENAAEPVTGRVTARFKLRDAGQPLVMDFRPEPDSISSVRVG